MLVITAPDGVSARIVVEFKERFTAAQATMSGPRLRQVMDEAEADGVLIIAPYLSDLARVRIREQGASYIDATGNIWLTLDQPAAWIEARGADRDPAPPQRGVRSLKGAKAGRLVRALCDWKPPVGVRELARRADVDAGYATRVLRFLGDEDVIRRATDGAIATVSVPDLLRRWARDYRTRDAPYLAPRGTGQLFDNLRGYAGRYAVTGSMAVPKGAELAPSRLLRCYVDDPTALARSLDLVDTDVGANVVLLRAPDPLVFERTRVESGVVMTALSQCVVDLLTGTGREPNQAETLLTWMEEHESIWRA